MPNHDLTSDLNSDNDFNDSKTNLNIRNSLSINLNDNKQTEKTNKSNVNGNYGTKQDVKATDDDDIKTPDIDIDYVFQVNMRIFKIELANFNSFAFYYFLSSFSFFYT